MYISCSVLMCEAGVPNTRCSQGCINSTQSGGHHHRRKREGVTESSRHLVSQGPLRLRRSAERTESPGMKTGSGFLTAPRPACCLSPSWTKSNSNCASLFSSDEPESEPGVHRWMSSRSGRHDQRSEHVQSQNVKGQIPTCAYVWKLRQQHVQNTDSVCITFEYIQLFWWFLLLDIGCSCNELCARLNLKKSFYINIFRNVYSCICIRWKMKIKRGKICACANKTKQEV